MKRITIVFILLLFAAYAHGGSQGAVVGEAGTRSYENVPYVSDHYPIVAELEF